MVQKYERVESDAYRLCHNAIDDVVKNFDMVEAKGDDGGPFKRVLHVSGERQVGEQRIWLGKGEVFKVVYVGLVVNPPGIDSHMMFAFTKADSPVPHFTVDSVHMPHMGFHAYHCEIMPRVDLAANLAYIDHVYTPLSEANTNLYATEGMEKSKELSLRQWALMSPWMLAGRANQEQFTGVVNDSVETFRAHWTKIAKAGIPDSALEGVDRSGIAERDRRNRWAAFHREVDPVYNQLKPLMGVEEGDRQIEVLRCQDGIETSGDHLKYLG